jgi:hypothetical protein
LINRVGGVIRAVFPNEDRYFEEVYLPALDAALKTPNLERLVSESLCMGSLPKDTLNNIQSKALHLDVNSKFSIIGLRFCSPWFHMRWVQAQNVSNTLALAFSVASSGQEFEKAILLTLPHVGEVLFRNLPTSRDCSSTVFDRMMIPDNLDVRSDLSANEISNVGLTLFSLRTNIDRTLFLKVLE